MRIWNGDNIISYSLCSEGAGNPVTTSVQSFKEIGSDIRNGAKVRADNALNSPYDFANYCTFGITGGVYTGAVERADKMLDSPYDFANWASFGTVGTVKGAFFPKEQYSKEHWLDSIGLATTVVGVAKLATSVITAETTVIEGTSKTIVPKDRVELNNELTNKGFNCKGTTEGGYVEYKHTDGTTVWVRPDGEIITVKKEWLPDGSKKVPVRYNWDGTPVKEGGHNTGEFVEKIDDATFLPPKK